MLVIDGDQMAIDREDQDTDQGRRDERSRNPRLQPLR
jgi:hypothetical protein